MVVQRVDAYLVLEKRLHGRRQRLPGRHRHRDVHEVDRLVDRHEARRTHGDVLGDLLEPEGEVHRRTGVVGRIEVVLRQGVEDLDRKSVVEGKSVSVRVDLGGRRIIKKKKSYNIKDTY